MGSDFRLIFGASLNFGRKLLAHVRMFFHSIKNCWVQFSNTKFPLSVWVMRRDAAALAATAATGCGNGKGNVTQFFALATLTQTPIVVHYFCIRNRFWSSSMFLAVWNWTFKIPVAIYWIVFSHSPPVSFTKIFARENLQFFIHKFKPTKMCKNKFFLLLGLAESSWLFFTFYLFLSLFLFFASLFWFLLLRRVNLFFRNRCICCIRCVCVCVYTVWWTRGIRDLYNKWKKKQTHIRLTSKKLFLLLLLLLLWIKKKKRKQPNWKPSVFDDRSF